VKAGAAARAPAAVATTSTPQGRRSPLDAPIRRPVDSPAGACEAAPVMRRRLSRAAWLSLCLLAAGFAIGVPASSAATRECFLLTQCTSVTGPWVVIPAANPVPIPAGTTVSCPDDGQLAVGSDYELSGGGSPPPFVNRFMPGPGTGLITGGNAAFFAVTFTNVAGSFRPHVGCIAQRGRTARAAATRRRPSHVVRTREVRLQPSRTVAYTHRCRQGERLTHEAAGVLFHRRRPPTARELRDVTVTDRKTDQRVRASVRTGPTVGDHERVTLQILAVCAR
jgi:hypothetical protein